MRSIFITNFRTRWFGSRSCAEKSPLIAEFPIRLVVADTYCRGFSRTSLFFAGSGIGSKLQIFRFRKMRPIIYSSNATNGRRINCGEGGMGTGIGRPDWWLVDRCGLAAVKTSLSTTHRQAASRTCTCSPLYLPSSSPSTSLPDWGPSDVSLP